MENAITSTESPEEAILDAAATVFAEHGFAGARVEAIAKAAGINKAMLYYRVGDKARLYELVVMRQFDRLATAVEQVDASDGAALEKLKGILNAVAGLFAKDPRLPRIMAWELASQGKSMPPQVLSQWSRIIRTVAGLVARTGLDPVLTHFSLVGPLVFTSLTEPVRKRFASQLPASLTRVADIGVMDMAGFLGGLLTAAAREEA
ncbi:TetR/AcrR family transcriptional regulator [Fundidesulfovibrio terrae]|uniref:TetR/AcrR family transcriptional regulator n=1 Tax=Fundidesulfovibrio terrae TaxID=2922866 RepID=UPI001FB03E9A|nr:TetR/AcrR family transcriptional regulator [Fundidesulfovibrio terrae]